MTIKTYKYFTIEQEGTYEDKPRYVLINKRSHCDLGAIEWYKSWRMYIFLAEGDAIWSEDCLADIVAFMTELNKEKQ